MNKKVFLYSGGFDSTLQSYLIQPDLLIYFDIGGYYSKAEIRHLKERQVHYGKELFIEKALHIGKFELDTLYLPYRNLLFILIALQYGDDIFLGFNEADLANDKTEIFLNKARDIIEYMSSNNKATPGFANFTLEAPYKHLTKSEIVAKCLENNMPVEDIISIRSCYDKHSIKGCGKCTPCFGKAVALTINGINIDGVFDTNPFTNAFEKHFLEEWPPFSSTKTYKEYEKIYKSLYL